MFEEIANGFRSLLGREAALPDIPDALRRAAVTLKPAVVGALHITCADESEWECLDAFQRGFVDILLPELKFAEKAAFRLSNLGARHELGAVSVAEQHFATREAQEHFKVLAIKVNSHVAVAGHGAAARFGQMQRYDCESTACGALHALLAGAQAPFAQDLREAFCGDGFDRLACLQDELFVPPNLRSLFIAVVQARRQLARVEEDIRSHAQCGPTVYLGAACVTLNRPDQDTELLTGLLMIDRRAEPAARFYVGMSDDPRRYVMRAEGSRLHVDERPSAALSDPIETSE